MTVGNILFNAPAVGIAFIVMFFGPLLANSLKNSGDAKKQNNLFVTIFVAAFYCSVAGVYLALDWSDPLANPDSRLHDWARARTAKGWILARVIEYWPYVLIGTSIYHLWNFGEKLYRIYRN